MGVMMLPVLNRRGCLDSHHISARAAMPPCARLARQLAEGPAGGSLALILRKDGAAHV